MSITFSLITIARIKTIHIFANTLIVKKRANERKKTTKVNKSWRIPRH